MGSEKVNNLRLGIFVSIGLIVLIVALYAVGKNQSFFGERFHLRAQFRDVNGLMVGNNVRYSGIQTGTVSKIEVINDTTIEIDMLIDKKMQSFIRSNAIASIGSEGLMGNKVINITQGRGNAPTISDGAMLMVASSASTDDMLQTLSITNDDVQIIAGNLKEITNRLNRSKALWDMLNDTTVSANLGLSMYNIGKATTHINDMSYTIDTIIRNVGNGEGVAGLLLADKQTARELRKTIENISALSAQTKNLVADADSVISQFQRMAGNKSGSVHTLFEDTALVGRLHRSMNNIEAGTAAFEENMEALKHNFLTRGYFKKQVKKTKAKH